MMMLLSNVTMWMLCRADMADQLAKVKNEVEVKARQDVTELEIKKSALLNVIKKYVHTTLFVTFSTLICSVFELVDNLLFTLLTYL